jgi:hypothetical protein
MSLDVNEFLLSSGVAAAKFEHPGTSVSGKITLLRVEQQREIDSGKPKYWDNGEPQMQIVCHVQTSIRDPQVPDDDGVRALYIRNNMKAAVSTAVRKSRAKLETGGVLTVTYTGDGERKSAAFNPPKLYAAEYAPPSVATVDDVLGTAPNPPAEPVTLPPGITAEQWAGLPQAAKEAMAKMHNLPPF